MADNKELQSAVQNFAESIGTIADAIYEQLNSSADSNSTVDNTAITAQFIEVTAKLEALSETVESTSNNTTEILNIVKGINKKKEKPNLIDKLSSAKTSSSDLGNSIATVGLMAASIMAMGLAFNVIGSVDFNSVMALSVALPLIALAFKQAGDAAGGDPSKALLIASTMGIMSVGLLTAGSVLYFMPTLSVMQLLTAGAVAVTIGIATAALAYAADEVGVNKIPALYAILPVMPMVATGIMLSSLALQNTATLSGQQLINVGVVALAMGLAMVPLAIAAKAAKGSANSLAILSVLLPMVAGGLALSSYELQHIPQTDFGTVFDAVKNIAPAMLLGVGVIVAMDKLKVKEKSVALGIITIPGIALGIALASQVLRLGHYQDTITQDWAGAFALSLLATVPAVVALGAIAATGFGAIVLLAGVASLIGVAYGIAEASIAIKGGNYTGGPTTKWAAGLGLSLVFFTNAISALTPTGMGLIFGPSLDDKIESVVLIGDALKRTADKVREGDYTGGPKKEWAEGVGLSLVHFTNAISNLSPSGWDLLFGGPGLGDKIESIVTIGDALKRTADKVREGDYTGGPKKEWAEGVGLSLVHFTNALTTLDPGVMGWFTGDTLTGNIESMKKVAEALPSLSTAVEGNYDINKVPSKTWAEGVGMALTSFADTLVKLEDEFEPEHIVEWSPAFRLFLSDIRFASLMLGMGLYGNYPKQEWATGVGATLSVFADNMIKLEDDLEPEDASAWSPVIRSMALDALYVSTILSNGSYDVYPSHEWTSGVVDYFNQFSNIKQGGNANTIVKNTILMANANKYLANSIMMVGSAVRQLGDAKSEGLSRVFGSLVTLSLIDEQNLGTVLNLVAEKQDAFMGVMEFASSNLGMSMVKSGIDDATSFTGANNNNKTELSATTINKSQAAQPLQVEVLNFPPEPPVEKDNSLNDLFSQLINNSNSTNILLEKLVKKINATNL
jgi:hypothetical protein